VPWVTARRDPEGMHVGFDIGGPARVTSVVIRLSPGGGESGHDARPGTDYRAFRGMNIKGSGVDGTFTVTVEATDERGCRGTGTAPHGVTVVVGG
jgi:hypothetical protein